MTHRHLASQRDPSKVHFQRDTEYTLCNTKFLSDDVFEGRRISSMFDTKKPVTCLRCIGILRTDVRQRLVKANAEVLEQISAML